MADRPMCANPDHPYAVPAVARISFPDDRFRATTGCSGCRDTAYREAMAEARPILIEPIAEAHGECPVCGATVQLRGDGTLWAHGGPGRRTCEGRGQFPRGDRA